MIKHTKTINIKITVLAAVLLFFQAFIGMYSYKDEMSAACLDCSFAFGILIDSVIYALFMLLLTYITTKINTKNTFKNILLTLGILVFFSLMNNSIFIDREASWSTYTVHTQWYYAYETSYKSMFSFAALFALSLVLINKRTV